MRRDLPSPASNVSKVHKQIKMERDRRLVSIRLLQTPKINTRTVILLFVLAVCFFVLVCEKKTKKKCNLFHRCSKNTNNTMNDLFGLCFYITVGCHSVV